MKPVPHLRILSLDPAPTNFGYAVIEIHRSRHRWRLLDVRMLQNPINEIGYELNSHLTPYATEISLLIDTFKPDVLVIERFMMRHQLGASMLEKVNIMIGIAALIGRDNGCTVYTKTAAGWKNVVQKTLALNSLYQGAKARIREKGKNDGWSKESISLACNAVPHTVDSTMLGLVIPHKELDIDRELFLQGDEVVKQVVRCLRKRYAVAPVPQTGKRK